MGSARLGYAVGYPLEHLLRDATEIIICIFNILLTEDILYQPIVCLEY